MSLKHLKIFSLAYLTTKATVRYLHYIEYFQGGMQYVIPSNTFSLYESIDDFVINAYAFIIHAQLTLLLYNLLGVNLQD